MWGWLGKDGLGNARVIGSREGVNSPLSVVHHSGRLFSVHHRVLLFFLLFLRNRIEEYPSTRYVTHLWGSFELQNEPAKQQRPGQEIDLKIRLSERWKDQV